jgi:tetratricopeptide (TPR) repeat protein
VGAIELMHRIGQADFKRSRELLEHLVARHPRSAAPLAQLAKWHVLELAQGWASDRQQTGMAARSHACRALDLDPDSALALSMESAAIGHMGGDLDEAHALATAAVEADAQEPHAWLTLGAVCSWRGEPEPAEELPLRAVALSPVDPARFLFDVFVAAGKLAVGKPGDAVVAAGAAVRQNAMHAPAHRLLVIGLVMEGRLEEARLAGRRLLGVQPGFRVSEYERRYAGRDRPHARERAQALRAAGLPD